MSFIKNNQTDTLSNDAGDLTITPSGNLVLDALTWPGADGGANQSLVTSGGGVLSFSTRLANIVEDVTPQLGAQLDVNTFGLGDGTLELLTFVETASAINHVQITNAAAGGNPAITAVGDDTNVGLAINPKGSDPVIIDGLSHPTADGSANQSLVTSGGGVLSFSTRLANVLEDVTPQLGAQLDVNGFGLGDGTLELLTFVETASAVNHVQITNAAGGGNPAIAAVGGDTNIGLAINPKGSDPVIIDGLSHPTADGTIQQILRTNGSGVLSFQSALMIASLSLETPTAADDRIIQHKFPFAVTITRVSASTDVGTCTLNFTENLEVSPNTDGSAVMTSDLVADTNSQITTTFSNATIAANAVLNLNIISVATSPGVVRIHVEYRPT